MTDVIFEAVALGVDSIISGSIVSMIVLVLSLSSKLNNYASMQETYAQSITYYRQYSKYNNTTIISSDALSALFYYDSNMDIYIVDANVDDEDASKQGIWIYAKEGGVLGSYKAAVTKDDVNSKYIVTYATGTKTYSYDDKDLIAADAYERYLSGGVAKYLKEGRFLLHTEISTQMNAGRLFDARLLEDLSKKPEGLYKGGTVTGIVMLSE